MKVKNQHIGHINLNICLIFPSLPLTLVIWKSGQKKINEPKMKVKTQLYGHTERLWKIEG